MDLQEMLDAELSENVNIVIETGGTSVWKNDVMSNNTNQRFLITSEGLSLIGLIHTRSLILRIITVKT